MAKESFWSTLRLCLLDKFGQNVHCILIAHTLFVIGGASLLVHHLYADVANLSTLTSAQSNKHPPIPSPMFFKTNFKSKSCVLLLFTLPAMHLVSMVSDEISVICTTTTSCVKRTIRRRARICFRISEIAAFCNGIALCVTRPNAVLHGVGTLKPT